MLQKPLPSPKSVESPDRDGELRASVDVTVDYAEAIDWTLAVAESRPWIERLVFARTGRADLVDDVLQELGLAVTRSESRPQRRAEIGPWLCQIVVRQCALIVRNQVRQEKKLQGLRGASSAEMQRSDPLFWLMHQEQGEIVRTELLALDPAARQLLIWKYVAGWRYQDIAARLGVTKDMAEYRVIEARRQLRNRLHERGIDEGETS